MKKRNIYLAAMVMASVLSVAGCGEKGNLQDSNPPSVENEILVETIVDTPTPEPVEETKQSAPAVSVQQKEEFYFSEELNKNYFHLRYCDVTVDGEGYESLKENIEIWAKDAAAVVPQTAEEYAGPALEAAMDEYEWYTYFIYQTVETVRADEQVVSLLNEWVQRTGGMHETSYLEGKNFDVKTGAVLKLQDVITDYEAFKVMAAEKMIQDLEEAYGDRLFDWYKEDILAAWENDQEWEWYLDATGLVIILQEYAVVPYSEGRPEIQFPYEEWKEYIKEQYVVSGTEGVVKLEKNREMQVVLPGRDESVSLKLQYEWADDMPKTTLWLGEHEQNIGEFATLEEAYVVRSGEEVYCMVSVDMASDDYITTIYRLTEGVIQEVDQIGARIDAGNISSGTVKMESWIYLLGTYGGVKNYSFDRKKGFSTADKEFILERNHYELTTKTDLPVVMDGEECTLPAGSKMVLTATDNESYVKFVVPGTEQSGTLEITRGEEESYLIYVNGISEYDCFEMLPYAG